MTKTDRLLLCLSLIVGTSVICSVLIRGEHEEEEAEKEESKR